MTPIKKHFEFSRHALEQMKLRNISKAVVDDILASPGQILNEDVLQVYQSTTADRKFLIRIFVNESNRVITVYKTSKIKKYYEGKI